MPYVSLLVECNGTQTERRLDSDLTIAALRTRLGPITGVLEADQKLDLLESTTRTLLASIGGPDCDELTVTLGSYPAIAQLVASGITLRVTDTSAAQTSRLLADDGSVQKYEMSVETYEQRRDTARAWMRQNKLGKYNEDSIRNAQAAHERFQTLGASTKPGDRCIILSEPADQSEDDGRRGTVRYSGEAGFGGGGYWIGVELDEPLGKHNGTVDGTQYFSCRNKHGVFVRPDRVKVGDYPEEDIFASDDDDELEEL
ncbi:Cap-Gly domain-containing protein [Ramicandelaber brevisporus]|nr:Cap-Gly domain-containing protein [Ramicandelaber brevisporus]